MCFAGWIGMKLFSFLSIFKRRFKSRLIDCNVSFCLCSCLQFQVVSMEIKTLPIIVRLLWCQGEIIPNVSNRVKDIVQVCNLYKLSSIMSKIFFEDCSCFWMVLTLDIFFSFSVLRQKFSNSQWYLSINQKTRDDYWQNSFNVWNESSFKQC